MIDVIKKIVDKKLTYLTMVKLESLVESCKFVESNNIDGDIVETGCALGGSSILLASQKNTNRNLYVYDMFGQIPEPTKEDPPEVHKRYEIIKKGSATGIGGNKYYGYETDLLKIVKNNFTDFGIDIDENNINFIQGDIRETLQINQKISLAHIDVDWYEPVKISLEKIYNNLSFYGTIILDDYYDWGGCRKAVDEFLLDKKNEVILDSTKQTMKIMKVR